MTVKELRELLGTFPEDWPVFMRMHHVCGNITSVDRANESSYSFFGQSIPCVLINDEAEEQEDEEEER